MPVTQDNRTVYSEAPATGTLCWKAIFAGVFTAMAVSLALMMLGSALGLSMMSPLSYHYSPVVSFTIRAAAWLIITQWIAAGLAGYLTGRLRNPGTGLHEDEVFFRDTAHGFLAWAVATVLTAALLASAAGGAAHNAAIISAGAASHTENKGGMEANDYAIDTLMRGNPTAGNNEPMPEARAETTRILAMAVKNGGISDDDRAYLSKRIAARSGVSQADASHRIDNALSDMTMAKETARKAGMKFTICMFLSLLIGAFIAATAAAMGGHHRALHKI